MCIIPHQGIISPLFSLFLVRLCGGTQGRGWRGSILVLYILRSQKPDQIEKTCHTIRSKCACVWNFSGWNSHPFLHDSIFYFEIWAISLFFLFPMLLGTDIFLFFCIAHIFLHDEYEESCQRDGAFLCGWNVCFCVISSVEVLSP